MTRFVVCRIALLALCAGWLGAALADETSADPLAGTIGSTNPAVPSVTSDASKWKISIGPGVMTSPKYPGLRALSVLPLPSLDIAYDDDRIFSQGLDVLGVNWLKSDTYHVGTSITFDFQSRNESDDPVCG